MIWRVVVRRAAKGAQFERVYVREFDDDLKAIRYGMWQGLLARFWGEFVHVQGPELIVQAAALRDISRSAQA